MSELQISEGFEYVYPAVPKFRIDVGSEDVAPGDPVSVSGTLEDTSGSALSGSYDGRVEVSQGNNVIDSVDTTVVDGDISVTLSIADPGEYQITSIVPAVLGLKIEEGWE